jgi:hypothetical protein
MIRTAEKRSERVAIVIECCGQKDVGDAQKKRDASLFLMRPPSRFVCWTTNDPHGGKRSECVVIVIECCGRWSPLFLMRDS